MFQFVFLVFTNFVFWFVACGHVTWPSSVNSCLSAFRFGYFRSAGLESVLRPLNPRDIAE